MGYLIDHHDPTDPFARPNEVTPTDRLDRSIEVTPDRSAGPIDRSCPIDRSVRSIGLSDRSVSPIDQNHSPFSTSRSTERSQSVADLYACPTHWMMTKLLTSPTVRKTVPQHVPWSSLVGVAPVPHDFCNQPQNQPTANTWWDVVGWEEWSSRTHMHHTHRGPPHLYKYGSPSHREEDLANILPDYIFILLC